MSVSMKCKGRKKASFKEDEAFMMASVLADAWLLGGNGYDKEVLADVREDLIRNKQMDRIVPLGNMVVDLLDRKIIATRGVSSEITLGQVTKIRKLTNLKNKIESKLVNWYEA